MRLTAFALLGIGVVIGCRPASPDSSEVVPASQPSREAIEPKPQAMATLQEPTRDEASGRAVVESEEEPAREPKAAAEAEAEADQDSIEPPACSDGKDNDGDGLTDWRLDLGCVGPDDPTEGRLETRDLDGGWTVFERSKDTRIIFVSSSSGSDENNGLSPEKPKRTIAAAMRAARNGRPDWVLLRRGDEWEENITYKEGRSRNEPFVVASYGDSTVRPMLRTGTLRGIQRPGLSFKNFAIVGIAFYAHTRDPDSPDYVSAKGESAFSWFSREEEKSGGVLIEDCWFHFYVGGSIQGFGEITDVVIRRNLFTNTYGDDGLSQGLFSKNASILLEENVFDHNGWYRQAKSPDPENLGGAATIYNHNTYFVDHHNTTVRGNIFLRPSSIGNKWTANDGPASASNIVIDDNLYVDCEVGISIGGNDREHPYRFKNIQLTNNVITDPGRSQPTNRTLGWCIDVDDWDGGEVARNLCIRQNNPKLKLTRGLFVDGTTRNVLVRDNVVFGLSSNKPLVVLTDGSTKENVKFVNNVVEGISPNSALVEIIGSAENYVFQKNSFHSTAKPSEWFKIDGKRSDFQAWTKTTGASDTTERVSFPDSSRSIEAYQSMLGRPATVDAFIEEARKQSKYSWRSAYTASEVNAWIRAGFGL